MTPRTVAPTAITVGERDREDFGDVDALAASIKAVGLLHPVVVTESLDLVAGGRRLAAVKKLGWTEVPVTVVGEASDLYDVLRAELEENTERKPLTPYEASRARERRAQVLAKDKERRRLANLRQNQAQSATAEKPDAPLFVAPTTDAQSESRGSNLEHRSEEPGPEVMAGRTRKVAAVPTGYSSSTIDKVDTIRSVAERGVVERGQGRKREDVPVPEPVREVAKRELEDVKKTGAAVDRAHRAVAQALETYLPPDPDEPHRKWRQHFLGALIAGRKPMQFTPEAVAERADGECLDELRRLVDDINGYHARVRELVAESSPDNVRQLRAV